MDTLSPWQEVRARFLQGADEYPDLSAHWESRQDTWTLRDAPIGEPVKPPDPQAERLFKETARIAGMLLHFSDEVAPWHVWLDQMRKKKRGFRHSLNPRTGTEARRLLEAEGRIDTSGIPLSPDGGIAHVFRESADLCADLASHNLQSEGTRYEDLPEQVRQLVERSALEIRAELQQLDSDYQSRIADAKRPEGLELLKQYCLERFDSCAHALLFTSISSDVASINPLYEQCLGMAEEKTVSFWSTVLQGFPPDSRNDVISWVNLKLTSRKLHWLAHANREHLKSHPAPIIDMQSIAETQARGTFNRGEGTPTPLKLPPRFQTAFQAEKAKAELEYATRAERFPNQQQFGNDPLHVMVLIQNVFFAFCTQARNACRAGDWTVAEASHAIDHAWPFICDYYFVREQGLSSEDARSSFRVALWRTVTDDARWKQHLSELIPLTQGMSLDPPDGRAGSGRSPSVTPVGAEAWTVQGKARKLNQDLIRKWMKDEGYNNNDLATALNISARAVSSLRNNGDYHGDDAVTRLANHMKLDVEDLYLP